MSSPNSHPFLLPPSLVLSPRTDVWIALAVTSCASVSSFGRLLNSSESRGNAGDKFAVSVCAVSFVVATVCAAGLRYGPFREGLTRGIAGDTHHHSRNFLQALFRMCNVTIEMIVLSLLSFLWMCAIPIVVDGGAATSEELTLAVAGGDIWNANLFYSSWASFILSWYLLIDVCTLHNRSAVIPRVPPLNSEYRGWRSNVITKRWILVSQASLIILSASLDTYVGPMCAGTILKQTAYCSRALVGVIVGGFLQLMLCLGVAVVCRLANMRYSRGILSVGGKNKVTFLIAAASLLVQSINVGLLTSPTGGGPATSSGTAYFSSWFGFILIFEMCLRYIEFFSTYGADGSRIVDVSPEETASVFSRREGPLLMIRSGSVSSNKRGGRSTGTASTSDEEDHNGPILHIVADHPPAPDPVPQIRGPTPCSEASRSQYVNKNMPNIAAIEPMEVFSIGSPARSPMQPESSSGESRKGGGVTLGSSSRGSGSKNPEGYYLNTAAAFGQQTSFHVDKLEELDQSRPNILRPQAKSRSKSPASGGETKSRNSLSPPEEKEVSPSTQSPTVHSSRKTPAASVSKAKHRSRSQAESRNSSRQSGGRANSRDKSRLTDSSSGTNDPPPTISDDGMSTRDTNSKHSAPSKPLSRDSKRQNRPESKRSSRKSGSRSSRGPPPPPFHRSNDIQSQSSGFAIPVPSIHTNSNPNFDMSEPTLDVHFDPPTPIQQKSAVLHGKQNSMPAPYQDTPNYEFKSSNSTSSYEYAKKWSDSTDPEKSLQRSTSDENPSSVEVDGPNKNPVDDIVAAALAYAEKTQCEDGVRSTSGASSYAKRGQATTESIHSFYSDSHQGTPSGQSVDDMVAKVLSQADRAHAEANRGASSYQNIRASPHLRASVESSVYSGYSEHSGEDQFEGQFNC